MRTRSLLLCGVIASGCMCGPPLPPIDAGTDASVDAGAADAGTDAGMVDAGPVCTAEVCDGVDNDCNGSIDVLADGGTIFGLCPLQLGTCQGARIACTSGGFPPCTAAQYGAKFEEFESLCDGVDNDCSGVVDVSQWKPIGNLGQTPVATSVPGAWFITKHLEAQMFDETLTPLTDPFVVGKPSHWAGGAVWFGDHLYTLYGTFPGVSYLRKLNLDGTFVGGPDELVITDGGELTERPYVSNDKTALVVSYVHLDWQGVVGIFPDGGSRGAPALIGDAGSVRAPYPVPVGNGFVAAIAYDDRLTLVPLTTDLLPGTPLNLAVPSHPTECAVSANTHALDAGAVVVACPGPGGSLSAVEDPAGGGTFASVWAGDAGTVRSVVALPSYAKATVFWLSGETLWLGQVNGLPPVELGRLSLFIDRLRVAESVRGGYLLQATFDGGTGLRPYGAYACPP